MHLLLHEGIHVTLSLLTGLYVWHKYKRSWLSMGAAFLGGVLVDLDHLIDYALVFGLNFNLNAFLKGNQFAASEKVYVFFHGFEFCVLLYVFYLLIKNKIWKAIILAFALGLLSHLLYDTYDNKMRPLSYFITYRAAHNFSLKELVYPEHYQEHLLKKQELKKVH